MTDAQVPQNAITNPSSYSVNVGTKIIYVRVVNNTTGCYNIGTITLTVNAGLSVNTITESRCDNDRNGSEVFNLTSYQENIISGSSAYTFGYYNTLAQAQAGGASTISNPSAYTVSTGTTTVYVRVSTGAGCYKITTITLTVNSLPAVNNVTVTECASAAQVVNLTTYNSQVSNPTTGLLFSFFTSQANALNNINPIPNPTAYNINLGTTIVYVRVENASTCVGIASITFNYNQNPTITAVNVNGYDIEIVASGGSTPYLYSVNGTTWQSGNTFTGLAPGNYTAYVKTANGCTDTETFTIILLDIDVIPSIITPNGDGINDVWNIPGMQYFPGSKVKLYDRYGKLIVDITTTSSDTVWDARYLNEPLPSTSYWYEIKLTNGKEYRGYLVIKNRFKK